MSEPHENLAAFAEHIATKDGLHRLVDGIAEDERAIVIVAKNDGEITWKTINLWRWDCNGLLETVRDEMRVIRAARTVDELP